MSSFGNFVDEAGVTRLRATGGGGGSQPGLQAKDFLFTEQATAGTYLATLPVVAGTVVADVQLVPLAAPWAADDAILSMGDVVKGATSYFSLRLGQSFPTLSSAYDNENVQFGVNYGNVADLGSNYDSGATWFDAGAGAFASGGFGIYYPADDALTMEVDTTIASPPVVPAGILLIRVLYIPPVTPTVPAFS